MTIILTIILTAIVILLACIGVLFNKVSKLNKYTTPNSNKENFDFGKIIKEYGKKKKLLQWKDGTHKEEVYYSNDYVYQLIATNTSDKKQTACFFGASYFLTSKNNGQNEHIKVENSYQSVSYQHVLLETAINPFKTNYIRVHLDCKDSENELKKLALTINDGNAGGQFSSIPVFIKDYIDKKQHHKSIADINREVFIDGGTYLSIDLPPHSKFTITIMVAKRINFSSLLNHI